MPVATQVLTGHFAASKLLYQHAALRRTPRFVSGHLGKLGGRYSEESGETLGSSYGAGAEVGFQIHERSLSPSKPHGQQFDLWGYDAHAAAMEIKDTRRKRLGQWFADRTLPSNEKSYISQLINGKTSFGERAARRLENSYGMPEGFLDRPLEEETGEQTPPAPLPRADHTELLACWDLLLEEQKATIMAQLRPMAAHNKAVMNQFLKENAGRVVNVHDRRKKSIAINHADRRYKESSK